MRFPVQWGYWTCIRQRDITRTCNSEPLWPRAEFKSAWMRNGATTQHLSSVKPLQLFSSCLPGHHLLLLPPLSLWTKLRQEGERERARTFLDRVTSRHPTRRSLRKPSDLMPCYRFHHHQRKALVKRVPKRLVWTKTNKHKPIYFYLHGTTALFTENLQVLQDC